LLTEQSTVPGTFFGFVVLLLAERARSECARLGYWKVSAGQGWADEKVDF
jgi:hypothetical protein